MAFCKVCVCGEKIIFQRRMSYPEYCPSCGRRTVEYDTYLEDDPAVEELLRKYRQTEPKESGHADSPATEPTKTAQKHFSLHLEDGAVIRIPDGGGIVGRTEIGAEELADYPSVSRKHLKVIIRSSGILLEDLSSYGTLVNGSRIERNIPVRVENNAVITLCNVNAQLIVKEE